MVSNKLLTPQEAARELNITAQSIRNYIKQGKLKAYKLERVYRIPEKEIEQFLQDRKTI